MAGRLQASTASLSKPLIYRIERAIAHLSSEQRLEVRNELMARRWDALHDWLELERSRVAEVEASHTMPSADGSCSAD
jgi:hypothetical protein